MYIKNNDNTTGNDNNDNSILYSTILYYTILYYNIIYDIT